MNASFQFEQERQELLVEAHTLISIIANKPNCLKLIKITVNSLRLYAGYKCHRRNRFGN